MFRDVQIEGTFSLWEHTHRFSENGTPGGTMPYHDLVLDFQDELTRVDDRPFESRSPVPRL
jgi:hypothetical protein